MSIISNPQDYDKKIPTNLRLREDLKNKAYAEAKKKNKTLSDVINEALEKYYSREG